MGDITATLNTDDLGFISQECPSCEKRFKVRLGSGSHQPVAHCPYCDRDGSDCWWTPEQAEYLSAVATRELLAPTIDQPARKANRSGGATRMSMSVPEPSVPAMPAEANDSSPIVLFTCCGETIRHDPSEHNLRCIICGAHGTAQPAPQLAAAGTE